MAKNNKNIPVNSIADNFSLGIVMDKIYIKKGDFTTAQQYQQATGLHRDDGHIFHVVEKGTVLIEIDFKKCKVIAPAVVCMHPNYVHRMLDFKDVTICSLAINNENLNPDCLTTLEEMMPLKRLALSKDACTNIADSFSLCLHFLTQKTGRLYRC